MVVKQNFNIFEKSKIVPIFRDRKVQESMHLYKTGGSHASDMILFSKSKLNCIQNA